MARRQSGRTPAGSAAAAARQAKDYHHPVPGPAELLVVLRGRGIPLTLAALAAELGLEGRPPVAQLRRRLEALRLSGQLLVNRRGEYCLSDKLDVVAGTVASHRDGFGFLTPDDGGSDVFLPVQEMRAVLDGDRVAVRVSRGRGDRRAGTVVEILTRSRESLVGRYHREHGLGWVADTGRSPHRFLVTDRDRHGAEDGQLVKLKILEYPDHDHEARGSVVEVLGDPDSPAVLTSAAIEMFHIPATWPTEVGGAASRLGTVVAERDKRGRTDLRHLPLVTIDGADARDFDDAVYAEPVAGGWRLVVAIADVSHYVAPGGAIDAEARRRGTSVYFPDRVVPMLPEVLSNELCSLKPGVDRLCMVCDMQVDARGNVKGSTFHRGVMHSHARLTYGAVDSWRRGAGDGDAPAASRAASTAPAAAAGAAAGAAASADAGAPAGAAKVAAQVPARVRPVLENLYGVFACLYKARQRRGALDLDLPEIRIRLDAEGTIAGIAARPRNDAQRLIEECMIAANVEAARYLAKHKLTTLYRVHAGPEGDKLEELRQLFQGLGIAVAETAGQQPREINRVLGLIRDRPDFPMLATAVLRSMKQAVYQPKNAGHFGLALKAYAHFTSPIRRYPDLLVHRGIGHLLDGGKPAAFPVGIAAAEQLGITTSMQERRAEEATRHVEARCKCLYMQEHVGESLDGVVTGVTHFGLFVMLRELLVDGLIHVTSLPSDYYHLEPGGRGLVGERTGRTFRLGDDLRVTVARVNAEDARIDLALDPGSLPRPNQRMGARAQPQSDKRPASRPKRRRRQ